MVRVTSSSPKNKIKVDNSKAEYFAGKAEIAKNQTVEAANLAKYYYEHAQALINSIETEVNSVYESVNAINLLAENINNINAVADYETNINELAQNIDKISSVANNITNINDVYNNRNNINTVANNMNSSNIVSNNIANVNLVGNSISNVNTVAANIDTIQNFNCQLDMINQSKALETGNVSTDSNVLTWLKLISNSTFDRSKFTEVGSPTITDDGIASGFSTSNYLTKNFSPYIDLTTQTLEIETSFIFQGSSRLWYTNSDYWRIRFEQGSDNVSIRFSTDTVISVTGLSHLSGDFIKAKLKLSPNGNVLSIYKNGVFEKSVTSSYTSDNQGYNSITSIALGGCYNAQGYTDANLDLKQFSITVDGVEVFSGNKTGVDTIKPDDYTTQSNTVITADGILDCSTSSDGAVITPSIDLASANNFTIELPYLTVPSDNNQRWIFRYRTDADSDMLAVCFKSKKFGIYVNGTYSGDVTTAFSPGDLVKLKVEFTGTKYNLYTKLQNGEWTSNGNYDSNQKPLTAQTIKIADFNTTYRYLGCFDLNTFKIYVDGDLVYQPCLKIPYTESKTGSKIVNDIYRPRVNDMAKQFGFAPYYTLQEDKKGNYTVVGSPTISSDFVASGFSNSNSLQTNIFQRLKIANSWQVIGKCNTLSDINTSSTICGRENGFKIIIYQGKLHCIFATSNTSWASSNELAKYTVLTNTSYYYKFTFTGSRYIFEVSTDNNTFTQVYSHPDSSSLVTSYDVMAIGSNINGSNTLSDPFLGSIDLKEFKIYTNGKLAYEAVTDPNFTLPQVELYGLIGAKTLRDSYENGINKWYLYSNRDLEQQGSCTSGVEVTLAKPFADTNYVLSVPYSAKSATAFTPTQTGDWFAKGKGVLRT